MVGEKHMRLATIATITSAKVYEHGWKNRTSIEGEWKPAGRMASPPASARPKSAALRVQNTSPDRLPMYARHSQHSRHTVHYQPMSCISYTGGSIARVSAYYSVQPPAMPLKLVAVAPSPSPTMSALPISSPQLPLAANPDDLNIANSRSNITSSTGLQERCKSAVRTVLCELMAALPLSTSSSPDRRSYALHKSFVSMEQYDLHEPRASRPTVPARAMPAVPEPPLHLHHPPIERSASPTTIAEADEDDCENFPEELAWGVRSVASGESDIGSCSAATSARAAALRLAARHVATQAHAAATARNVPSVDGCKEPKKRPENSDEWLGGVRALRDSHVRLVLRQLRHIERLNRALDRASRGSTGAVTTHIESSNKSLDKQLIQ